MSLIENAIKKIQGARGPSAAREPISATGPGFARRQAAGANAAALLLTQSIPLNQEGLRSAGLLPPPDRERELAQQFRRIKRPLIDGALGRGSEPIAHGDVILVTSAAPGEGKTFVSLNLALNMHLEEDATVLLVDGDVANPRLSRALGTAGVPGLLDLIRDPSLSLSSVVLATDVKGLAFLPAGRFDGKAADLLASARMSEVLSQLRGLDPSLLILFDSGPLLLTTESHVLAEAAGQILLVVCADRTPRRLVLEALHTLDEGRSVSLVLNQSMQPLRARHHHPYGSGTASRDPAAPA